uniref:Sugar transporter SWEET n=1 Tax=Aplanochytrium stocchinoi TaxID=215587 RepID=A0A6S8DRU6_9STRA|mmetsp:Transcript_13965/g.17315  ORF Transcript_13965/g.17315 Transcript_13965/m.17315 type:complete len:253 (-) Transcript_13965:172-930(-)|eukprot:CAMPEP_0204852112 /NCGR_PEP_ID=MMETSP1347-20130617/11214_1 /ASSEMBLY_ACC=CAM_ASM_000690 /TAXON_ID=215587 /ORGANISM="Aplanochytrium stocchinoi, Strain GSBS06" /LENGTH=252 /DNA_ID=CAMNT_0051996177 /DNA_START=49 /DNA_END=807 /DNA_ORIENTATION=+
MSSTEVLVPSDTTLGTFLSVLPQITCIVVFLSPWKTVRSFKLEGTTKNLPMMPYVSLAVQSCIWTSYGYLIGAIPVMLPNVVGTLLGVYYTFVFHTHYRLNEPYMLEKHYLGSIVVLALLAYFHMQEFDVAKQYVALLGMTGTVIFSASPLVMIFTVCREKSIASLPFDMALLVFINSACWIFYGVLVVNDYALYLPNMLGFLAGTLQLLCHVLFGNPVNDLQNMITCKGTSKRRNSPIEFDPVASNELEVA